MWEQVDRDKLFAEVWAEPVQSVAKRYGLSDVGLKKLCSRLQIPTPARGHWAKLKAGKAVTAPPTLPVFKGNPRHLHRFVAQPVKPAGEAPPLDERLLPVVVFERDPANHIRVPSRGTHWHPLVAATRDAFNSGYKDNRGIPIPGGRGFDIAVSVGQRKRAFRVLNTLVKALEKRGYSLRPGDRHIQVEMFGSHFTLGIYEPTKRSNYVPTEKELAAKSRGEQSYWPRYQYAPSGTLEIRCGDGHDAVVKDTVRQPIEEQLNLAVEVMARRAISRLRYQEEQERLAAIREKRRQEALAQQAIQDAEKQKLAKLIADAQRWQQAETVRTFLRAQEAFALEAGALSDQQLTYLAWARAKANWLDPLVAQPDAILDQKIKIPY